MTNTQALPSAVLLIDVGNTRLKAGWVIPASAQREATSIAINHADIAQLETWLSSQPVHIVSAVGVNVASDAIAQSLSTLLQQHCSLSIHWATSQAVNARVRNGYAQATQLGPDRWMGMLGLTAQQDGTDTPMMLVNFGTATTIDTLIRCRTATADLEWEFIGGLILPGVELMSTSLNTGTARLPAAQGSAVAFPDSTQLAISSGVAAAQAGAVLRQWLAVRNRYQLAPKVFGAGGAWPAVQSEVQRMLEEIQMALGLNTQPVKCLASPVLDGLARLACTDLRHYPTRP